MEENNFRNYSVCAKVSANQKNIYNEKALRKNLSLSEWVGSTLDMSVENEEDIYRLKTENNRLKLSNYYNREYIKKLEIALSQRKENINSPKMPYVKKQTTTEMNNSNKISSKELNYLKSTANGLNTIGVIAILGAFFFKSN
jgi:hypothetical protein